MEKEKKSVDEGVVRLQEEYSRRLKELGDDRKYEKRLKKEISELEKQSLKEESFEGVLERIDLDGVNQKNSKKFKIFDKKINLKSLRRPREARSTELSFLTASTSSSTHSYSYFR